jgi:hypothetical protein
MIPGDEPTRPLYGSAPSRRRPPAHNMASVSGSAWRLVLTLSPDRRYQRPVRRAQRGREGGGGQWGGYVAAFWQDLMTAENGRTLEKTCRRSLALSQQETGSACNLFPRRWRIKKRRRTTLLFSARLRCAKPPAACSDRRSFATARNAQPAGAGQGDGQQLSSWPEGRVPGLDSPPLLPSGVVGVAAVKPAALG